MMETPKPEQFKYSAVPDLDAYQRISKRLIIHNRQGWLRYCGQTMVVFTFIGTFSTAFGLKIANEPFSRHASIGGACFSIVAALLYVWWMIDASVKGRTQKLKDSRWECTITDDNYSFDTQVGIGQSIPWRLMRLELEDPDAWAIKYCGRELIVFRQSLRDAGLEEEFRRRIPPDGKQPGTAG